MSKEFKVGDLVKVYGHKAFDWEATTATVIERGVDVDIQRDLIMVRGERGLRVLVHPKQCRKLVKKKRAWKWMYKPVVSFNDSETIEVHTLKHSVNAALSYNGKTTGYRRVKVYLKD